MQSGLDSRLKSFKSQIKTKALKFNIETETKTSKMASRNSSLENSKLAFNCVLMRHSVAGCCAVAVFVESCRPLLTYKFAFAVVGIDYSTVATESADSQFSLSVCDAECGRAAANKRRGLTLGLVVGPTRRIRYETFAVFTGRFAYAVKCQTTKLARAWTPP